MTWYELPELPKPDTKVLAVILVKEEFPTLALLSFNGHLWWYLSICYDSMKESGWLIAPDWLVSSIKRWAYIEED